jgi:hypothetical protein
MKPLDKKLAIAAYKERKAVAGIYMVRCATSGEAWIGQSPTLDTVQNRIWFALRLGSSPHADLQKAWHEYGADNFTFEIVEQIDDEEAPYFKDDLLKRRLEYWRLKLEATPL